LGNIVSTNEDDFEIKVCNYYEMNGIALWKMYSVKCARDTP